MKNLQLSKPHLLVVVGIPGSGKTFFAEKFGETFSAPFIDEHRINDLTNDHDVSDAVTGLVLEQLFRTKQTVIIEGRGSARTERQSLATMARSVGYEPLFIWVQTDPATAEARAVKGIRGQKTPPKWTAESFEVEYRRFTPLHASEKYMVISGRHTYASQAKIVLKKLVEPRSAAPTAVVERPVKRANTNGRITIN